jgi:hypothetical protein
MDAKGRQIVGRQFAVTAGQNRGVGVGKLEANAGTHVPDEPGLQTGRQLREVLVR